MAILALGENFSNSGKMDPQIAIAHVDVGPYAGGQFFT